MSTELRTRSTAEWVCTRWCAARAVPAGEQAFDFGSAERFARLEELSLDFDLELVDELGAPAGTLRELLLTGTSPALFGRRLLPTFGEFVGTVELGSGELFERLGFES